jgi:hypothetical protein
LLAAAFRKDCLAQHSTHVQQHAAPAPIVAGYSIGAGTSLVRQLPRHPAASSCRSPSSSAPSSPRSSSPSASSSEPAPSRRGAPAAASRLRRLLRSSCLPSEASPSAEPSLWVPLRSAEGRYLQGTTGIAMLKLKGTPGITVQVDTALARQMWLESSNPHHGAMHGMH